jgi:hypothetical protein
MSPVGPLTSRDECGAECVVGAGFFPAGRQASSDGEGKRRTGEAARVSSERARVKLVHSVQSESRPGAQPSSGRGPQFLFDRPARELQPSGHGAVVEGKSHSMIEWRRGRDSQFSFLYLRGIKGFTGYLIEKGHLGLVPRIVAIVAVPCLLFFSSKIDCTRCTRNRAPHSASSLNLLEHFRLRWMI